MFFNYITFCFLLWLQVYFTPLDACAATNPGVVTTTTTTTTTTTASTTTTVATECNACTLDNPSIEHIQKDDGAKDIEIDVVTIGADGCALRTITCAGTGAGSTVILAWNNDEAGTTIGTTGENTVTDTLVCNAEGTAWILSHNFYGPEENRPITQVECLAT